MSEQFNFFERLLAKKLEQFPAIKRTAKLSYQKINYLLYKKPYKYKCDFELVEYGDSDKESFFGYYDKSPENKTKEYIIYQESTFDTKNLPSPQNEINVVLFDVKNKNKKITFSTVAYNWQQGTKLQWLSDYCFIFNYCDKDNNYRALIIDARTSAIIKQIDWPIYDTYSNIALTLNYDRLNKYRPDYGYRNHIGNDNYLLSHEEDGVFLVDLERNTSRLLISIDKILRIFPVQYSFEGEVKHKFNHIMISPNGEKFMFLHRFFYKGRKYDRLFVADISGENICLLSDHDMVSHCYWQTNDKIIGYLRRFETGDGYYEIYLKTKEILLLDNNGFSMYGDGHPSVYKDKVLFDTYPNKSRMKQINIYDIKAYSVKNIGEFLESLKFYGETRCDLHPRWNTDGTKIFIDSVHSGKRRLYSISLEK